MLGLDLVVEEVEDAIRIVLVVADLEMIDGMWWGWLFWIVTLDEYLMT